LNFGISIGAITFSAETEIAFSTNFDFCQMAVENLKFEVVEAADVLRTGKSLLRTS
jgi:hypothetical protein